MIILTYNHRYFQTSKNILKYYKIFNSNLIIRIKAKISSSSNSHERRKRTRKKKEREEHVCDRASTSFTDHRAISTLPIGVSR